MGRAEIKMPIPKNGNLILLSAATRPPTAFAVYAGTIPRLPHGSMLAEEAESGCEGLRKMGCQVGTTLDVRMTALLFRADTLSSGINGSF
jgi:hypothetical protein